METYTKAKARELMGAKTDAELARLLGIKKQAVHAWGGDGDPIPEGRHWQVKVLVAERRESAS